jgi:hypothetical protein
MMNTMVVLSLILGSGALGAGLSGLHLNLLNILGLNAIGRALKMICGLAGLVALYHTFNNCDCMQAMYSSMEIATIVVLIATNIGVGISGLGTNVLRTLHIESLQKPFQLIAGSAGVYALARGLQLLAQ